MRVLWALGEGRVEDVRRALPESRRGAYTTVQTVLSRLAERNLLKRERRGKAMIYSPRMSEAEYLSDSLQRTLQGASKDARRAAIAQLVGGLKGDERREVQALAKTVSKRRSKS